MRRPLPFLAFALSTLANVSLSFSAETYTPGQAIPANAHEVAKDFIAANCLDCHSGDSPEGDLSLENLGPVDEINSGTWRSIWAQVALKEMPPKDMDQPAVIQRLKFTDIVVAQMQEVMKDKGGFRAHLDPNKGNFLDHDLLFSDLPEGVKLLPTSSPARIWRVTPEEHITRLNELINSEAEFDPKKPGLRTHGDAVPTNHGGELKLYFGTDRIIKWQGGTVAYATSVKSLPAILSNAKNHGLSNYPDYYTVNSAEATQIMSAAADILRYMALGPLSIANPEQITDDPNTYKTEGDLRGLPTAIVYSTKVVRPLTPVLDLFENEKPEREHLQAAVNYLFEALTFRPPTDLESDRYVEIVEQSIAKLGKEDGSVLGLSAVFLDRDALFRPELVEEGEQDEAGRLMLQDWELGLAVNHALRYIRPDEELRSAIADGRMRTRDDVKREVERMLTDESIRKPRVLQFFRDYFDYDLGGYICKDSRALGDTGASNRGQSHYRAMFDSAASTDRLIEMILQDDQDVLKQLLTTDKVVATKSDNVYFGTRRTEEERKASIAAAKLAEAENLKEETAALESAENEFEEIQQWMKDNPKERDEKREELAKKKKEVNAAKKKLNAAKKRLSRVNHNVNEAKLEGPKIFARVSRRSFGNGSMKPERILATVPEGERLGILTHPSWLVSHSDAMDNHAIHRGRWIRERLLGGGIPDVPITVDAMLPDEPHSTLRERMRVTREDYCWTCHQKMDPLGLAFEMYNHAGLHRTTELKKPVDTSGEIIDSGDSELDGKVKNAIELIQKIADSERAEQVFVRHAFRFWMGRNETLNDAPVLRDAHNAYKESGGSMRALLVSLLTSDAFLYRTRNDAELVAQD